MPKHKVLIRMLDGAIMGIYAEHPEELEVVILEQESDDTTGVWYSWPARPNGKLFELEQATQDSGNEAALYFIYEGMP